MEQEEEISQLANKLTELENERKEIAQILKNNSKIISDGQIASFDFLEDSIEKKVECEQFTGNLIAIDGSVLTEELTALDLLLYRSVAVEFNYQSGKLQNHEYYPSAIPRPSMWYGHSLQSHEFNWAKNLKRLNSEINCAIKAAEKFHPKIILLDGSIVPQVTDRPSLESNTYEIYEELLENLKALYTYADDNGTILAGVIKDSRGRHFINLIEKYFLNLSEKKISALESSNDTAFLYNLLEPSYRTSAFKYSSSTSEELVLRDLGEYSKRIASFYLRAVEMDRPLRVDFLLSNNSDYLTIDKTAKIIYSLSRNNREYGYPAALIEADLRAVLEAEEMEFAYNRLFTKTGLKADMFKLRRNTRPFR